MIFHIITIILLIAKIMGYLTISWWLVFTPSIIAVVIGILVLCGIIGLGIWSSK